MYGRTFERNAPHTGTTPTTRAQHSASSVIADNSRIHATHIDDVLCPAVLCRACLPLVAYYTVPVRRLLLPLLLAASSVLTARLLDDVRLCSLSCQPLISPFSPSTSSPRQLIHCSAVGMRGSLRRCRSHASFASPPSSSSAAAACTSRFPRLHSQPASHSDAAFSTLSSAQLASSRSLPDLLRCRPPHALSPPTRSYHAASHSLRISASHRSSLTLHTQTSPWQHTASTATQSSSSTYNSPFSLPSCHFSSTVIAPLHPPFPSKLTDTEVPDCDDPSLNPASYPSNPALPGPLSSIRSPSHHAIRHILIYKKVTTLEEIRRGIKRSIDFPYLSADAKVLAADREHQHTIAVVRASIAVTGVEWKEVEVIDESDVRWADAIICVGGDGTFLKASRHIQETDDVPIVGVNSAPSSSFGFFSAADHHSFPALLSRLLDGTALLCPLWRARLCVNHQPVGHPVLNEILFCNPIPSATTRYLLTNHGVTQLQQSSGIWISTAAGSTGAILGAGGSLMHLSDWRFQYRIRELFSLPITHPRKLEASDWPHIHYNSTAVASSSPLLTHGFLHADFHLVSRMMSGCLYLDGSIIAIPVQFNDTVSVRRSARPLQWVCPTKEGEGIEQIDHWELVTGLRRSRMPDEGADGGQVEEGLAGTEAGRVSGVGQGKG